MKLASSDARNTTALAISSGLPSRPIGTAVDSAFSRCCPVSDEAINSPKPGVSVDPGDIAFTRMRRDFKSVVQVRARRSRACRSIPAISHSRECDATSSRSSRYGRMSARRLWSRYVPKVCHRTPDFGGRSSASSSAHGPNGKRPQQSWPPLGSCRTHTARALGVSGGLKAPGMC
jgi:hypothetical protein